MTAGCLLLDERHYMIVKYGSKDFPFSYLSREFCLCMDLHKQSSNDSARY